MARKILQHPSGNTPEHPAEPKQYGPYDPSPVFALSFMEVATVQRTWYALESLGELLGNHDELLGSGIKELLQFVWQPLVEISERLEKLKSDDQDAKGTEAD